MPRLNNITDLLDANLLKRGDLPLTPAPALSFTIATIDSVATLQLGAIHAWALQDALCDKSRHRWNNPLILIATLLGKSIDAFLPRRQLITWVGQKTWPTPHIIQTTFGAHTREDVQQLYLQPYGKDDRLWTAVQFLRYPQSLAVVVDASGFSSTALRRLNRAAQLGGSALLLLCPAWELSQLSAVQTKWLVAPLATKNKSLTWELQLLKAPALIAPRTWTLTWEQDESATKNTLALFSDTAHDSSSRAAPSSTQTTEPLGLSVLTDSGDRLSAQRRSKKRA